MDAKPLDEDLRGASGPQKLLPCRCCSAPVLPASAPVYAESSDRCMHRCQSQWPWSVATTGVREHFLNGFYPASST